LDAVVTQESNHHHGIAFGRTFEQSQSFLSARLVEPAAGWAHLWRDPYSSQVAPHGIARDPQLRRDPLAAPALLGQDA
jgi:hypothetical protein